MTYNQFPYNIFDQNSIEGYIGQQHNMLQEQHHSEQQRNIVDMRKAISDYCRAARKITPDYHQRAIESCLEEILGQALLDGLDSLQQ